MSDDAPRPTANIFQRLRPPAALNYLILMAAGLFVYGLMMMSRGNDIGAVLALLLALAGLFARWTAAPVLILLLTTYLLIDPGFVNTIGRLTGTPWFFPRPGNGFNLEDVLLAGGLLAYTIGHYRLTGILYQGMPHDPTAQRGIDPANPPRRPVELVAADELSKTLIVAGACLIVGQAAWTILCAIERGGRPHPSGFSDGPSRFLLLAWVLGLALMIVSAALVYLRGSGMTRAEATVLLRDEFFDENRRETDRIQRWRKWFKERVALRRRAGK
jgi:hypothetical protein